MFKSFTDRLPALVPTGKGEAGEPELPSTMEWAVKLMLVGAAMSTVFLVFAAIVTANVKGALVRWNATLPKGKQYTASQISDAANSYIATTIIIGLIAIALWLFMTRMNRKGRNWARITATVFFVLWTYYTYVSIGQTRGSSTFIAALVLVLAIWFVGLAALFLLWRPPSNEFYRSQSGR
jgi:uncharacterized membrane protein YozB (DUF420 family)